uniref:Receptor interacting serine/threonine kinase 2 n=1 Tax=Cyprinodon variegatus TaxID=28743 RepID=A0A3Q2ED18_CYPVA
MERHGAVGCVNIGTLTSTLPAIPYQKLTDLYYLSRGGFGTVFKAQHSDWRTTVAIKCLKLDSRNCLLKEAEVLHKARFNHIIQIFGVCNEPEFFCIVTEFMSNGSLDQLLHEVTALRWFPRLLWGNCVPSASGADEEYLMVSASGFVSEEMIAIKINDFRFPLSKRFPIVSAQSDESSHFPKPASLVQSRAVIDCYAIIMWEVLSRQIPYEEVTNPMQIMFSVLRGKRPDTSQDSLSADIPSRETLISLMTSGWTANPDERPSFLKCLIELEPMVRRFDEIEFLEAVLEIKRSKVSQEAFHGHFSMCVLVRSHVLPSAAPFHKNKKAENGKTDHSPPLHLPATSQGPVARWIEMRREDIVLQMTEACLNQSLDALLARSMLMREDYELVVNQPTRTAKVRQLLDNCHKHDEDFCRIVVRKLVDNNQGGLKPYPPEICSPTSAAVPSAPPLSVSYSNHRNF